ncbi:MAG TPA: metal ABC transporter permease, partial [Deinococcales bacterium]|nr:metal ABC transporter permease [Deinococcales bacterium]
MLDWLIEPLRYPFFARAVLGVALIAALCAVVGVYVVLRGLSYIGDAMAHAVFPGIVGAFLLQVNFLLGALVAAVITALGINLVTARTRLRQDSAIGIAFVGMFALGVTLLSLARTSAVDLTHLLIGNPLAVQPGDLYLAAGAGAVVLLVLYAFQKELLLAAFDPTEAAVIGLPVERLNALLLVLISMVVVLGIQMVGSTLVVSLLVTSAAAARLLTNRVRGMMLTGAVLGALAGVTGLYLSYYLDDAAPGATIVLVNTVLFAVLAAGRSLLDRRG